jgi:hypothetical protein
MKTKYLLLSLFILLPALSVWAQQSNVYVSSAFGGMNNLSHSRSSTNKPNVAGSPYFNQDWMFGELTLKDSSKIKTVFKYNVYNQQLEFVYKQDTFVFAKPLLMDHLSFAGKTFVYALELDDNEKTDYLSGGFFQVLNDDFNNGMQLLAKLHCTVDDKSFSNRVMGGVGSSSRPMYVINKYYYIRKNNGAPAIKLKKSKDFVFEFFNNYKDELDSYIKKNNLRISDIKDLSELIDYYNSISTNNLSQILNK